MRRGRRSGAPSAVLSAPTGSPPAPLYHRGTTAAPAAAGRDPPSRCLTFSPPLRGSFPLALVDHGTCTYTHSHTGPPQSSCALASNFRKLEQENGNPVIWETRDGNDTNEAFPPLRPPPPPPPPTPGLPAPPASFYPRPVPFQHSNARLDRNHRSLTPTPLWTPLRRARPASRSLSAHFPPWLHANERTPRWHPELLDRRPRCRRFPPGRSPPPSPAHTTRSRFRTHAVPTIAQGKAEGR